MRGLASLLIVAAASCSDPAEVAPRERSAPSGEVTPAGEHLATSTSEELAFLASEVCLPQVSHEDGVAVADLERSLTGHGYRLVSDEVSRQIFGRVTPGFLAARKANEVGRFLVAFGEGLPACAVLLTDDSVTPPAEELRAAFQKQGWERAYLVTPATERAPYASFRVADRNGKTILAVARDEPESDRKVRLGIDISYTAF